MILLILWQERVAFTNIYGFRFPSKRIDIDSVGKEHVVLSRYRQIPNFRKLCSQIENGVTKIANLSVNSQYSMLFKSVFHNVRYRNKSSTFVQHKFDVMSVSLKARVQSVQVCEVV